MIAALASAFGTLILLVAYAAVRFGPARGVAWRLPDFLLLWTTIYWLGAVSLVLLEGGPAIEQFATIASVVVASMAAGALLVTTLAMQRPRGPDVVVTTRGEVTLAALMGTLGALVCVAFVAAVVRNEELGLMLASVVTGDGSFLEYRLAMSSGSAVYLAPGYVKQFRDVLLPVALLTIVRAGPTPWRWFPPLLAVCGLSAALLSGERYVLMLHVFVIGAAFITRPGRKKRKAGVIVPLIGGAGVFGVFLGLTVLLGRAEGAEGPVELVTQTAVALFERIVLAAPRENASGYLVWGALAPTWGATWQADLAGILPGVQANLSNELHELLGGSAQGASPLGLPADVFLAWGYGGAALWPFLFIVMLHVADEAVVRSPRGMARVFRLVLVPLTFAWYSPFLFLLNGGAALLAAAAAARLDRRE